MLSHRYIVAIAFAWQWLPPLNPGLAAPPLPEVRHSTWQGYERLDFVVAHRPCLLVKPKVASEDRPWIWRMEFFDHEPQVDLALLATGYHLAYMDLQDMYGAPSSMKLMDQFYDHVIASYGLCPRVVLEGFSRGGLFSLNWAARRSARVASIYNDAPVCDFKSWPGGKGRGKGSPADWQTLLKAYELGNDEALRYTGNPIDNLAPLAKEKIAIIHVCGADDDVVPIEENTQLLAQRYRKLGGEITVIKKPGVGHHPHSLKDPAPIVQFIVQHARRTE